MGEYLIRVVQEGLLLALLLAAPAVGASVLAGILSSALQVATRLQDPALSAGPRLILVAAALWVAGPWIGGQAVRFAAALFEALPYLARG